MNCNMTLSKETLDFARALHSAAWQYLSEQLTAEQRELARDVEGCFLYAGLADGTIHTTEAVRRDAPHSLMETIADTLARLPRERWPDQAHLYADQCPLAFEALRVIGARLRSVADG